MTDFVGYLTNCFIMGDQITENAAGSCSRNRIDLSFAGFDMTLLQDSSFIGTSFSRFRGQTLLTTEVHVKGLRRDRLDDLLDRLQGLTALLSFATVSEVSLCGWEYLDGNPRAKNWTVVSKAQYFRPVIQTMNGSVVRAFLEETFDSYFLNRVYRKLPVVIDYFVTAETRAMPMELKLATMFILFENLKSTFAAESGYPYQRGYYRKDNGTKWSFRELLEAMFQALSMTPDLSAVIKLRNEIIHSGISELDFSKYMPA